MIGLALESMIHRNLYHQYASKYRKYVESGICLSITMSVFETIHADYEGGDCLVCCYCLLYFSLTFY